MLNPLIQFFIQCPLTEWNKYILKAELIPPLIAKAYMVSELG